MKSHNIFSVKSSPDLDGIHFADDKFKYFMYEKEWILTEMWLHFILWSWAIKQLQV